MPDTGLLQTLKIQQPTVFQYRFYYRPFNQAKLFQLFQKLSNLEGQNQNYLTRLEMELLHLSPQIYII